MEFRVDYSDVQRFNVQIGRKLIEFPNQVKEAIRKSTLSIKRQAITNLTNNGSVQTGHLRRSIKHKVSANEGIVSANTKYAEGVEKGTKPHIIRAKKKKALYWQGANHPVKVVNHPGSAAKPYLIPALEAEQPKFIQNLKEAIQID